MSFVLLYFVDGHQLPLANTITINSTTNYNKRLLPHDVAIAIPTEPNV
jgi:hypothetical protein